VSDETLWRAAIAVGVVLLFTNLAYYAVSIREDFKRGDTGKVFVGLITVTGLNLIVGWIVYHELAKSAM
jgi:hypothetical protein